MSKSPYNSLILNLFTGETEIERSDVVPEIVPDRLLRQIESVPGDPPAAAEKQKTDDHRVEMRLGRANRVEAEMCHGKEPIAEREVAVAIETSSKFDNLKLQLSLELIPIDFQCNFK